MKNKILDTLRLLWALFMVFAIYYINSFLVMIALEHILDKDINIFWPFLIVLVFSERK